MQDRTQAIMAPSSGLLLPASQTKVGEKRGGRAEGKKEGRKRNIPKVYPKGTQALRLARAGKLRVPRFGT